MTDVCDTVPSAQSSAALVRGEKNALPLVLIHTAGRAALIGIGLAVVGEKHGLVKKAVAGAIAIEVFLLSYHALKR